MKRIAIIAVGALALGAGAFADATPARADEEAGYGRSTVRETRTVRRHAAHRPRRLVREIIVERPVYRTRIVREVIVERPIYRPRRIVREVFFDPDAVGPPPFAYGPPPRFAYGPPRFAYGPRFVRPPLRPVGYGPGFGYGPFF
ncbi:hypothetical protein MPPM_2192 [Methylorubrum populi]|uniref:Uncharacterized protein n=1 Tax=Methylorubrum populi TaxID=223967 RepID=A0A160PCS8_9HYPH|nr:hypothetical protein [Methylorubrum populi]BAU90797.1 hypothetical protein MPPM_2192 [Methylorubrum populi]